jgi:hypothetical protein
MVLVQLMMFGNGAEQLQRIGTHAANENGGAPLRGAAVRDLRHDVQHAS